MESVRSMGQVLLEQLAATGLVNKFLALTEQDGSSQTSQKPTTGIL